MICNRPTDGPAGLTTRVGVVVALLLLATILCNSLPAQQPSETGRSYTADLTQTDVDYPVMSWGVPLRSPPVRFAKEPVFSGKNTVRGYLAFGASHANEWAFAWDRAAGKVYFDFNGNQDLTDDPSGVFRCETRVSEVYQRFSKIRLPHPTATNQPSLLANLGFYSYGTTPTCMIDLRTFWQGKVSFEGREYQAGLVESFVDRKPDTQTSLLLRPWGEREKSFMANGASVDAFPFPAKLFLNRTYAVEVVKGEPGGPEAALRRTLRFTEEPSELGELKLDGQYLERLLLQSTQLVAMLERPSGSVRIPLGVYGTTGLLLKQGEREASPIVPAPVPSSTITVTDQNPAVAVIGGPLTNSVTVDRRGQHLYLSYQLLGAGGQTYQMVRDRTPPDFTVHHGNRKIGSGSFEFG